MKRQLILWISALGFSTLFYNQNIGLNLFIFAIIAIIAVVIMRPEVFKRADMRIASCIYLLTSFFVFTNHSSLAIFMSFITFIIFAGTISGAQNSIYVQGINGLYQSIVGALHYYMTPRDEKKKLTPKKKRDYGFIILTVLLVVGLPIIFATLYSKINPIFEEWVNAIDLSFINFSWMLFTLMGYLLINNITAPASLDPLTNADRNVVLNLSEKSISETQEPLLHKEQLLGSLVIGVLNALILFFLVVDVWYVTTNSFEHASELSKTVHEGVNALIASIIIAISLILIFFRGNLNFYKKSKRLRILTYIWILLNCVLVLITAYKNYIYITDFGLTYKRIGVGIYLTLCIAGLLTTYLKVAYRKNVMYLVRLNARIAFIVIVMMSSFSWNREITRYNLSQVERPDLVYLESMGRNHIDLLYAFAKAHPEKFPPPRMEAITYHYENYIKELQNQTWQSKTLQGITYQKMVSKK
ncbi:hypothetical protein GCM10011344_40020 [Dokdonia pacifica]|uniref:Uncharacterized protein n=1 Tax=Dokdonia pacifica TaxID=1627892 RepID=A0A239A7W0_9FLAO|nr:DUF4173 domain-containing protein [Dokdonia pacifica]GGG35210.1 hypothetical protein GCM10011344_40020 [Dokdonia pacifica]SNR91168.1 protein of unknown function [Dokdonia pacifica]